MEEITRRTFIKRAGTAAAAAGVVAVAPATIASAATKAKPIAATDLPENNVSSDESIVAHVLGDGEIQLFVGDRELNIHDRSLSSRIIHATR